MTSPEPRFFRSQKEWRAWLEKNHATKTEQWVGFHKVGSDRKGITYKEAVDEALCFGWIDAVRRGGDATWSIRFTPRKKGSIWSAVNIRRIEELKAEGLVAPAGLAAYASRDPAKQQRKILASQQRVLRHGKTCQGRQRAEPVQIGGGAGEGGTGLDMAGPT